MTRQERRGLANLAAKRPAPPKSARWVVRIYYRSQGDELLCCDSDPLTRAKADALRTSLNGSEVSRQVDGEWATRRVSLYDVELAEVVGVSEQERRLPLRDARRAVLPHQRENKNTPCSNASE